MREDATLVNLAVQGDSAAFAELYERYFDRVFDFLARMLRNDAEAADLAQDTFLRAMNSLGSLAKGASFKSWLFTIARNTALNRIERSSRVQSFERKDRSEDDDEPSFDVVDSDRFSDPEEAAEAKSLAAFVWEAAKGLDPNQYAVLDLSVRQELESAEIADVLGVTKNNAYVMVNRMKKSLEDAIGALVLFKSGRGSCPELDAALTKLELGEMSSDARRLIDRHSSKCAVCSDRKKKLASPFAIFGAFGMVQPIIGTKEAILEGLLQSYPYAGAAAGAATGSQMGAPPNGDGGTSSLGGTVPVAAEDPHPLPLSDPSTRLRTGFGEGSPGEDDGGSKTGLLKFVVGVAALLLLGLTSFIAVNSQDGDSESSEALVIAVTASSTPAATPTIQATAAVEAGETEEALAPPDATPPPATPVAAQAGPTQPAIAPPPAGTATPQGPQAAPPIDTPPALVAPPVAPPCVPAIAPSVRLLDFGTNLSSLTFTLGGNNCGEAAGYSASSAADWLTVLPASGQVPPGGSAAITVRLDRSQLWEGGSTSIEVKGTWGTLNVAVRVSVAPTPTATLRLIIRPTSTPTPCVPITPSLPCP